LEDIVSSSPASPSWVGVLSSIELSKGIGVASLEIGVASLEGVLSNPSFSAVSIAFSNLPRNSKLRKHEEINGIRIKRKSSKINQ
jgi:hypothetical protein